MKFRALLPLLMTGSGSTERRAIYHTTLPHQGKITWPPTQHKLGSSVSTGTERNSQAIQYTTLDMLCIPYVFHQVGSEHRTGNAPSPTEISNVIHRTPVPTSYVRMCLSIGGNHPFLCRRLLILRSCDNRRAFGASTVRTPPQTTFTTYGMKSNHLPLDLRIINHGKWRDSQHLRSLDEMDTPQ